MEEALSKNKPEHVGQPGPLPAWIDVLTPDEFAMIENRESMANDNVKCAQLHPFGIQNFEFSYCMHGSELRVSISLLCRRLRFSS